MTAPRSCLETFYDEHIAQWPRTEEPATHELTDAPQAAYGLASLVKRLIVDLAMAELLAPATATRLLTQFGLVDK
jgi:hypothetical protein